MIDHRSPGKPPIANPPVALSIAGSDPSGGAGIQADLKTLTALGVYGAAAITSLTVQNTTGVRGIHPVPPAFVADQCRAVLADLDVAAIKIGMLGTADIAAAVADVLGDHPDTLVVLDPVMVAASGDRLVDQEVIVQIRERLLGLATVITPNLPETGTLLDAPAPVSLEQMQDAAAMLRDRAGCAVLVKGGHLAAGKTPEHAGQDLPESSDRGGADQGRRSVDVLADGAGITSHSASWVDTPNTHGTGCTLSSAIAAGLARGYVLRRAVDEAKTYLSGALQSGAALRIGHGSGPVDHLWNMQRR